jgi:hypothetical protein
MLVCLGGFFSRVELVEQALDLGLAPSELLSQKVQPWHQQQGVLAAGLAHARSHGKLRLAQTGDHIVGGEPADPVLAQ